MMKLVTRLIQELDASLEDDKLRSKLQLLWLFRILCFVASFMTVVNILNDKELLGWSTFVFALLCLFNNWLAQRGEKCLRAASAIFIVEFILLLIFYIVTGTPEGFSALWICMLPTFGIIMFGRKKGSIVCAVMLAIVLFFFDTPLGNSFLQYGYTTSFKLRFPMLYASFYILSLFLETVRVLTQRKLIKAREQYRYLYVHDALTGLYNRYGFNERMNGTFTEPRPDGIALLIVDIDHFKDVNDRYGHMSGDMVLKEVARRLQECVGASGVVCRWGGEEFAVLVSCWKDADRLGEKICQVMRDKMMQTETAMIPVTVSAGVYAVRDTRGLQINQFVRETDRCLYEAKESGRDRVVAVMAAAAAG